MDDFFGMSLLDPRWRATRSGSTGRSVSSFAHPMLSPDWRARRSYRRPIRQRSSSILFARGSQSGPSCSNPLRRRHPEALRRGRGAPYFLGKACSRTTSLHAGAPDGCPSSPVAPERAAGGRNFRAFHERRAQRIDGLRYVERCMKCPDSTSARNPDFGYRPITAQTRTTWSGCACRAVRASTRACSWTRG
jgi:hypothetical protein